MAAPEAFLAGGRALELTREGCLNFRHLLVGKSVSPQREHKSLVEALFVQHSEASTADGSRVALQMGDARGARAAEKPHARQRSPTRAGWLSLEGCLTFQHLLVGKGISRA